MLTGRPSKAGSSHFNINLKEAEMAVFHRYAGPCRNPKCNRTVRSNGFTVYCWSCTALDIRYGDPRQRRITQGIDQAARRSGPHPQAQSQRRLAPDG